MANRYWLKFNEHFFDDDKIVWLESQKNGEKYVLIWVKLLLKCLKSRDEEHIGFLRFTDRLPYNDELLAKAIDSDIDTLRVAMKHFFDLEMIARMDDGTIYIEAVQHMTGKESGAAERMRRMRERKKLLEIQGNTHSDCNIVTVDSVTVTDSIHDKNKNKNKSNSNIKITKEQNIEFDNIFTREMHVDLSSLKEDYFKAKNKIIQKILKDGYSFADLLLVLPVFIQKNYKDFNLYFMPAHMMNIINSKKQNNKKDNSLTKADVEAHLEKQRKELASLGIVQ